MKTHIYMDVDGVLNGVMASPGAGGWDREGWNRFTANGFQITFHSELMDRLRELDEREDVVFHWLTTWCDDAPRLLSPHFGIGADWPVLGKSLYDAHLGDDPVWWKYQALIDAGVFASEDKVVWIDDDHGYYFRQKDEVWLTEDRKVLRVMPRVHVGISKNQFAKIIEFIDS